MRISDWSSDVCSSDPFPALHSLISERISGWLQFALATPVVIWAGWPFFERGWASVRTRNLNMFTLIAMGTGVAWAYSVVATAAPGIFPAAFRMMDGTVAIRSEEHTSELQSLMRISYAVFCLKKKNTQVPCRNYNIDT